MKRRDRLVFQRQQDSFLTSYVKAPTPSPPPSPIEPPPSSSETTPKTRFGQSNFPELSPEGATGGALPERATREPSTKGPTRQSSERDSGRKESRIVIVEDAETEEEEEEEALDARTKRAAE